MAIGIYSAAAGMAAQQARIDALANDVSNASTPGYRAERVAFRDLVYGSEDGVSVGSGVATVDAGLSSASGSVTDSSNPLDLAIDGTAFFQVRRADGSTALTRAGSLQIDAAGSLVLPGGQQLVPPIKLPNGTQPADVSVAPDGTVSVTGKKVGQIQLVDVASPNALVPSGDNLLVATPASGAPTAAKGSTVQQGRIEGSAVDIATAMTDMIDAQRSYDLSSRVIKMQDELLSIANGLRS